MQRYLVDEQHALHLKLLLLLLCLKTRFCSAASRACCSARALASASARALASAAICSGFGLAKPVFTYFYVNCFALPEVLATLAVLVVLRFNAIFLCYHFPDHAPFSNN